FIVLIALGVFTIVLSRQNFLQKKYPVQFVFEEIGGLREGDHVFLRGTQVGVVKSTHLENNHVIVRSDLEVPVEFREGYKVEVVAACMLGGKALKIYEGPLQATSVPPSVVIRGEIPIDILEELGVAVVGLRKMSEEMEAGKGTLGKLLQDSTAYDEMIATMGNLNKISQQLVDGKGTLGRLLSDDQIIQDLSASVENLKTVSTRLVSGEGTLGKLLSQDDQFYNAIQNAAENLQVITKQIAGGEGTLGKLIADDEVYIETQELLAELRAAIDDMRETSPVTTFSTVLFGAF
ncbi:MAG: MCE family protein, partial [Victivallales bacterium]|nr:MCE family protein [Victivallales bacterium]